jgi:NifU-like protein involved in Fe-S cluster formation
MLYNQKVLHYYQEIIDPKPLWQNDAPFTVTTHSGDKSSGELVVFQVKLDSHNLPIEARFQVLGCGYMIALVAWLSERVVAGEFARLENLTMQQLVDEFELPKHKHHSAMCLLDIIKQLSEAICVH